MIALGSGPTWPQPAGTRGNVYLPIVANQVDPVTEFLRLLKADTRQQRPRLDVCPCLMQGALWRATGLANGEPWDHKDRQGRRPNGLARSYGCTLPAAYSDDANYIEELTAGTADPLVAFTSLANSPMHKIHLFGENDFYRVQTRVGVAMAEKEGTDYRYYWVVWIAAE